jgi:ARG/rhodanese/phosphatase superfamily protein
MRRRDSLVGIVSLLLLAMALAASAAKPAPARGAPVTVGHPISHGNLTVFPVYAPPRRDRSSDYLTLEEALQRQAILVKELPSSEVNRVSVTNKADRPIYLLAGDIILGGKQDRELARDTVVAKGATGLAVEVFCVEHGRWEGASQFSGGEIASAGLRLETQKSREQGKVWARVAQEAVASKAATPSGTYRAVARRNAAQPEIEATVKALGAALARDPRAVGVVAAINGKVTAADVFADRKLFQKELPKLLKSYALDAAQQRDQWARLSARPKPTAKEAMALLRDADRGVLRTTARTATALSREREGRGAVSFETLPAGAALGGFGGGISGAVPAHRNIYRKP